MWVGIQASVECGACGEKTAANAAVGSLCCGSCGADLSIHPDLWASSLQTAAEDGPTMDVGAVRDMQHHQGGATLFLRMSRQGAKCAHCSADLSDTRPAGDSTTCPGCATELSVRTMGGVPGLLVGEDRSLVRGEARSDVAPEQVACPGCGSPVGVDGSERAPKCPSCDSALVVPDEVWRRVHAPGSVSTWYVFSDHEGSEAFDGDLAFSALEVGADGVVYGIGYHDGDERVFAFDTQRRQLLWATPCSNYGDCDLLLTDGVLWARDTDQSTLRGLDPATGADCASISFDGVRGVVGLAAGGDGTLVACLYPDMQLVRVAADGSERPLWPPAGFFARWFGSNGYVHTAPVARPTKLAQGITKLVHRPGGGLHVIAAGGGVSLGTVGKTGDLEQSTTLPVVSFDNSAGAAPDGTVHVVGLRSEGCVWLRVRGDTVDEIREVAHTDVGESGVGLVSSTLAVGPDGDVWFGDVGGLERFDADGKLKWSLVQ